MSQTCFDDLPPEVIFQVFDYLSKAEHLIASTVCTRWHEILSSKRYTCLHQLRLKPHFLVQENFNSLNRYRSVSIVLEDFAEPEHRMRLFEYMVNSEMAENIRDLKVEMDLTIWKDMFGDTLILPNLLTTYIIMPDTSIVDSVQCRIVTPNLKRVKIDDNAHKLLNLSNENIQQLYVVFKSDEPLVSSIFRYEFTNLISLILETKTFVEDGFHSGHATLFSRLQHLAILDWADTFFEINSLIFEHSKNLLKLELYGHDISQSCFTQISQMCQLNELIMMLGFERESEVSGLSLPKLEKLQTLNLIPLDNVPKLKALTIAQHPSHITVNFFQEKQLIEYFQQIGIQLEELTFANLSLKTVVDHISMLPNLKSLEMIKVTTVTMIDTWILSDEIVSAQQAVHTLEQQINSLENLKTVRFTNCSFADRLEPGVNVSNLDCFTEYYTYKSKPATDLYKNFYSEFAKNVHCQVVAEGGWVARFYPNLA